MKKNIILTEPWIIEFKEEGVLRTGKICLLDADFIKHIAESRAEKIITSEFIDDPEVIKKCYVTCALEICEELTFGIRDPIIFCFSGKSSNTFRHHIAIQKKYKGNRAPKEQLVMECMNCIVETIMEKYVGILFPDLEADDVLCMLQNKNTYIHSKDKDLKQVPGWHYDRENHNLIHVTSEDAVRFLAKQLITGDPTDHISGIEGYGEKKAEKILQDVSVNNLISTVYREYKKKYGIIKGTDLFTSNWQLIKMRENHGEYFKEKYRLAFSLLETIEKQLNLTP